VSRVLVITTSFYGTRRGLSNPNSPQPSYCLRDFRLLGTALSDANVMSASFAHKEIGAAQSSRMYGKELIPIYVHINEDPIKATEVSSISMTIGCVPMTRREKRASLSGELRSSNRREA